MSNPIPNPLPSLGFAIRSLKSFCLISSEIPLVTTTFNTGYIESASAVVTLGCVLSSLQKGPDLWPQLTGMPEIDTKRLSKDPRNLLVVASSDVGYNFAIVIKPNKSTT